MRYVCEVKKSLASKKKSAKKKAEHYLNDIYKIADKYHIRTNLETRRLFYRLMMMREIDADEKKVLNNIFERYIKYNEKSKCIEDAILCYDQLPQDAIAYSGKTKEDDWTSKGKYLVLKQMAEIYDSLKEIMTYLQEQKMEMTILKSKDTLNDITRIRVNSKKYNIIIDKTCGLFIADKKTKDFFDVWDYLKVLSEEEKEVYIKIIENIFKEKSVKVHISIEKIRSLFEKKKG